jgi:hypothetical protein
LDAIFSHCGQFARRPAIRPAGILAGISGDRQARIAATPLTPIRCALFSVRLARTG